jgi:hypothetical protein
MNPWITIFIIFLNGRADFSGYAETRVFLTGLDSINFIGYSRGWLELKTDADNYGGQAAFDYIAAYDSAHFTGIRPGIDISRLAVWLGPENLRLTAGKQRIQWGVARVFRPLDLINPVNFFELGYERAGFPAILAGCAPARLTDIRLLCLPRFNLSDIRYAGRFGTNLYKNDIGVNIFYRPADAQTVLGGDLAGEFGAGYWAEGTYTRDDTASYGKLAAGLDYTFPSAVYAMAEYFYDQSGEHDPGRYDYQELITGARSTLGQNYIYLSIALARGLVLSPGLNAVCNLDDRTGILIPQTGYQPWDNVELNFGASVPFGLRSGEFRRTAAYDLMIFLWAKVFF